MRSSLLNILKRFWVVFLLFFVVIVYFLLTAHPRARVASSVPVDGGQEISQTSDIFVNFEKELSSDTQEQIQITISPEEEIEFIWLGDRVKIVPREKLDPGTAYTIKVSFRGSEIFRFSFTTALFTQEQLAKEGALQSQDDLEFGEAFKEFVQQYPWYLALPIERNEYRVVYDFEESSFRIRLKLAPADEETEQKIIERALEEIRGLGIKDPVPYYVVR